MRQLPKILALCALVSPSLCRAQGQTQPARLWSVGPLTQSRPTLSLSLGTDGAAILQPNLGSQTESIFAATRRVAFAGDRIVLAIQVAQVPRQVYELLSLDLRTGALRDSRTFVGFGLRAIFATNDEHVIVSGTSVLRLTSDLRDDGSFDFHASGHRNGRVENISPDGSTLGNATSPGFELLNAKTLEATQITTAGSVDTSVNSKGFITDNIKWIGNYPEDVSFIGYTDALGLRMIYHGHCGGRPQFLTDDLIFEPGCKESLLYDLAGSLIRKIAVKDNFSYAGVSQNGKRFALQLASFSSMHTLKKERFAIYSVETGERVTEVSPDAIADEQSWSAFSPDGSLFVVGSPLRLTLYRLP
jgi:hypothetical protein